jgi:hypothetical protein
LTVTESVRGERPLDGVTVSHPAGVDVNAMVMTVELALDGRVAVSFTAAGRGTLFTR